MSIDINALKTSFKTIMDAANTTTADYDLSSGMNTRVNRIMKIHPLKIPVQPSYFPYVTIFANDKEIRHATIAKNQLTGKRMTDFDFVVIGAVWEQITYDIDENEANEEIERLMENVEEVLRRNQDLSATCDYIMPTRCSYQTFPGEEEAHLRMGEFHMTARINY